MPQSQSSMPCGRIQRRTFLADTTTGLIEGVLVRGETDFTYRSGGGQFCRISYRCANDACRGEDVTKISAASAFIPRLPNEPTEPVVPTL